MKADEEHYGKLLKFNGRKEEGIIWAKKGVKLMMRKPTEKADLSLQELINSGLRVGGPA